MSCNIALLYGLLHGYNSPITIFIAAYSELNHEKTL